MTKQPRTPRQAATIEQAEEHLATLPTDPEERHAKLLEDTASKVPDHPESLPTCEPTQEEIAEACEEIRKGWSRAKRKERRVVGNPRAELVEVLIGSARKGSNTESV